MTKNIKQGGASPPGDNERDMLPPGARLRAAPPEQLFLEYKESGDMNIREQLITHYLDFAYYLAKKFANRGEPLDDLKQVAALGLIKAVDNYDPAHGTKFTTYATACIVGELRRYFRNHSWQLKVPRRIKERWLLINEAVDRLTKRFNRSPNISEIAEELNTTEEEILDIMGARELVSLDEEVLISEEQRPITVVDILKGEEDFEEKVLASEALKQAMGRLKPIESQIIKLRFYENLSLKEIARRFGISHTQVLRIQRQALSKLKKFLEGDT